MMRGHGRTEATVTLEPAVLALDLGTGEAKAGLIAADGRLAGFGRADYPVDVDAETGRAEQDPDAWWRAICAAAIDAFRGPSGEFKVVAICAVGQGPTLVAADATGRPTRPAIGWLDSRSRSEAAELESVLGLRGWALGILPKALWLERHEPRAAGDASWYLSAWEWLGLRLSGAARATVAVGQQPPDRQALASVGLAADRLPPEIRAGVVLGELRPEAAADLGLPRDLPVVAGLADALSSFLGAGLIDPGDAIDTGGTSGGFAVYWSGEVALPAEWRSFVPLEGRFALGGAMSATGRSLEWLRDDLLRGHVGTEALIDEAAATSPGAGGLIFLPYLAGERAPIWDSSARGTLAGLSLAHSRGHLVRAVLEASAFAIRHVAEPILAAGVSVTEMRICGGPGRSATWNQIKADVTGFRVAVPAVRETAVVGAAILAAVGIGLKPDLPSAMRTMVRIESRLDPRPATRETYDPQFAAYKALYSDLRPTFARLAELAHH